METTNEKKYQSHNLKIMLPYKILSFDLLFFYSISYLFLVDVKSMTTSQIVFSDAFYPLFKLIFQFPSTLLIQKIGKKKSLIIANLALCLYLLLILNSIGTITLIIANAMLALSFAIKNISEPNLLYDSIGEQVNKRELFAKYEGKSIAGYYFFDAITSIMTGFLFIFNPYLPIIISLLLTIFALILALNFYEISDSSYIETTNSNKSYFKDLSKAFKYIFRSPRLRSLIIFNGVFASLLSLNVTLQKSLLDDINVSSNQFGIIFAVMGIVACFSSNSSLSIHHSLKNKTLFTLGIIYSLAMVVSASVIVFNIPAFFMVYILLIMIAIQYAIKGPFYTLIKRYLGSFCNSDMRVKIFSANALVEYSTGTIFALITSLILKNFSNSHTVLLVGIVSSIIIFILAIYMHSRTGLKPEEYSEKDLFFDEFENK